MSSGGGFFLGLAASIGGGAILTGIGFAATGTNEKVGLTIVLSVGLLQLSYVIPLYLQAKRKNQEGMRAGLIVGGSLVFLITAACAGLLLALSAPGSFR
jgi:hypothetical protein